MCTNSVGARIVVGQVSIPRVYIIILYTLSSGRNSLLTVPLTNTPPPVTLFRKVFRPVIDNDLR